MTIDIKVVRHELPPIPVPKPGDYPIFQWDSAAEIRAGEIVSAVRRFAYWDERDNQPLEVGYETFVDGLPDTGGVADVVATHPDVLADLAAVSAKAAEVLREMQAVTQ